MGYERGSAQRAEKWALALRLLGFVMPMLCLPAVTLACLWDRDTLRYEAKGLPGIVEVITGRFEREPPLYYEMRLERVTREIGAGPTRLDLYDDAGVACDRLHRGDEAIEWMVRKKAAMDAVSGGSGSPDMSDHSYRYHANLGTFLAHRWLRGGADRSNMQDMLDGCEHIRKAIEINADAHFGREKYQLLAMEWIVKPPFPPAPSSDRRLSHTIFDALPEDPGRSLPPIETRDGEYAERSKALMGLVVMGDAWQSVDIYIALAAALQSQGHTSLSYMAVLRAQELIDAGKQSLNDLLRSEDPNLLELVTSKVHMLHHADEVMEFYAKARRITDEWHSKRAAFITSRLEAGRHPDTDPAFWDGYRETRPPTPPGSLLSGDKQFQARIWIGIGVASLIGIGLIILSIRGLRSLTRFRRARRSRGAG